MLPGTRRAEVELTAVNLAEGETRVTDRFQEKAAEATE